jgi:hypothetical protein
MLLYHVFENGTQLMCWLKSNESKQIKMIVQLKDSNQLLNKQLLVHAIKISLPHSLYISLHKRYKKVGFDICGSLSRVAITSST